MKKRMESPPSRYVRISLVLLKDILTLVNIYCMKKVLLLSFLILLSTSTWSQKIWPIGQANAWYNQQPWLVGCNFIPSTAINELEMWQADTWDPKTIDRELGWAQAVGFNVVRVYLHNLVWEADANGFKKRISEFLTIAEKHKIK